MVKNTFISKYNVLNKYQNQFMVPLGYKLNNNVYSVEHSYKLDKYFEEHGELIEATASKAYDDQMVIDDFTTYESDDAIYEDIRKLFE